MRLPKKTARQLKEVLKDNETIQEFARKYKLTRAEINVLQIAQLRNAIARIYYGNEFLEYDFNQFEVKLGYSRREIHILELEIAQILQKTIYTELPEGMKVGVWKIAEKVAFPPPPGYDSIHVSSPDDVSESHAFYKANTDIEKVVEDFINFIQKETPEELIDELQYWFFLEYIPEPTLSEEELEDKKIIPGMIAELNLTFGKKGNVKDRKLIKLDRDGWNK
jgi:hypothetical protein